MFKKSRPILAMALIAMIIMTLAPATASAASGKKGFSKKSVTQANKMMKVAKSRLGKPYVSGATGPNSFDCSGFVYYCMKKSGIKFKRGTAASYKKKGYNVGRNIKKAQKGDIILYSSGGGIGHCALYMGKKKVIHATCSKGIAITRYNGFGQSVAAIIRTYTPGGEAVISQTTEDSDVDGMKYRVKGKKVNKIVKTNSAGRIKVKNLKSGKYTITPVDTPAKYEENSSKKIRVKNGKVTNVKFHNELTETTQDTTDNGQSEQGAA
ncbi:MAG: NlpC/P60 family protein [Eubacteriaceae bacterium]|nr:NlpC/P60 family protein [Eubacteriaceae bacterium]